MDLHPGRSLSVPEIESLLTEARARTHDLVAPLSEADLRLQHNELMSPIVWDLGHIAHFEEVWLLENLDGARPEGEGLRGMYDPFSNPRAERGSLGLPSLTEALDYLGSVRSAVLARLEALDLDAAHELIRHGFVFRMVLQHEYQHNETMLQTLQLKRGDRYAAVRLAEPPEPAADAPAPGEMVRFPGGSVLFGTDDRSTVYDNERPQHERSVQPFWIDAHPVTNGEFLAFVEDGGYDARAVWSDDGWAWRREAAVCAPRYWVRADRGWAERFMDRLTELDGLRPVSHVSYWEAEAFASWAGKRLPTELEWEAAASWDPDSNSKRRYPWGDDAPDASRANLDALLFETTRIGSYPRGISPIGCWGMLGDVWEWTSSDFEGYPGYRTFPYPEYSEVFLGDEYKVLRGGAWATRFGAIRNTFRNWDYPIRRQIFSGIRCARGD